MVGTLEIVDETFSVVIWSDWLKYVLKLVILAVTSENKQLLLIKHCINCKVYYFLDQELNFILYTLKTNRS